MAFRLCSGLQKWKPGKKKKKKRFLKSPECQTWGKNRKFHLWCCISTFLLDQNQNNVALSMIEFRVKHIGKYLDIKLNYWGRNLQQSLYDVLLLRHCQTLKGIKLYHGNLKCLPLHAHTKEKKKKKGKKIYKIPFISIFEKSLSRGFHLINAKRQPNNGLLCSKIRKGKRWEWACHLVPGKRTVWFQEWKLETIFCLELGKLLESL